MGQSIIFNRRQRAKERERARWERRRWIRKMKQFWMVRSFNNLVSLASIINNMFKSSSLDLNPSLHFLILFVVYVFFCSAFFSSSFLWYYSIFSGFDHVAVVVVVDDDGSHFSSSVNLSHGLLFCWLDFVDRLRCCSTPTSIWYLIGSRIQKRERESAPKKSVEIQWSSSKSIDFFFCSIHIWLLVMKEHTRFFAILISK